MTPGATLLTPPAGARSAAVDADPTERLRRAEAERDAVSALLTDLLSAVSHDLRNPLNAIAIAVDELDDPTGDADMRDRYVAAIRRAVGRSDALIRDLVDVGRIEMGELTVEAAPASVARLLESARERHAGVCAEAGVALTAVADPQVELVRADRERILQVLTLLIENALRHTPRGGSVELRAGAAEDEVRFSVRDTGRGVAPEALPHLFDRFGSDPARRLFGRRLGLVLCRGIVEAHGGRIGASSELGAGSELWFSLPAADS